MAAAADRAGMPRRHYLRLQAMNWAGVATVLAGCGTRGQAGEEALSRQPPQSVPLTIWARGPFDKLPLDEITPLVQRRFPHLAVTVEAVTGIYDKIVVAVAGGSAPDLTVVNMPSGVPMIGQGLALNLQPYVARDRGVSDELTKFAPPALQAYRFKGDLHAIPVTSETIVLWYNDDLVRRANLVPPQAIEHDRQKWTWNTLLDYARTLNRGHDQEREVFGLHIGNDIQSSWGNLVYSNGGRILTEDGTKLVLSEPAATEALQWAVDTIWKQDVGPQPAMLKTPRNRGLFVAGRLAMTIDGEFFKRWLFGPEALGQAPFNLAQIPFAPRTQRRGNVFHSLALPILRASKTPEAAWQYVRVLVTNEAMQIITDRGFSGARSPHQQTYESWLKGNAGGGPPANYAAIVKSDAHGVPYPASPYLGSNDLFEPMNRLLASIFDNTLAVRTGLQQVDQETNARLEPAVRAAGAAR